MQPRDTRHCKHLLVVLLRTNYVEQRSYNSLWLETEPLDISIINEKHNIMSMDCRCKKHYKSLPQSEFVHIKKTRECDLKTIIWEILL